MRVGVIPFRVEKGRFQICLVSSLSKPDRMTFPKGIVKRKEAWEVAALRELYEEAGCEGEILLRRMPLVFSPRKRPEDSCVFFWCEIKTELNSWPEKKKRNRVWHTLGLDADFLLTRNAGKVYEELLAIGLDQDEREAGAALTAEDLIRQRLAENSSSAA